MIFADDLGLPEGPVLLPDGSWAVTELAVDRGCVSRLSSDGRVRTQLAHTGRPNGLALDRDGVLWVAESDPPGLLRLEPSGVFERILEQVDGRALLWPNDLCFGADGALYITDSGCLVGDVVTPHGINPDYASVPYAGIVFRFDPQSGAATILDEGYRFTNGIAFGPDARLYVTETLSGDIYRYRIDGSRVVGDRELFGNVLDPADTDEGFLGPDGIAFSEDGRLWVAVFGQRNVTVLDRDGAAEQRLQLVGSGATNVAFGPPGQRRIYVTDDDLGQIEAYDVGVDGLALYTG